MKNKKYYKIIKLGVFPYQILFCQGMDLEQVQSYLIKKYKFNLSPEEQECFKNNRLGKTIHLANNATVLWLKHPPKSPETIANLAHEALHAVLFIYNTMGIPINQDNDEVVAYALGHVVEQVLSEFKK